MSIGSVYLWSSIAITILGATAAGFTSFKISLMENLREGISPTPGQKIVYKIASFYLFSLTLVLALGSWFLLGFSINYGLAFTSWGISQSVLAGFLAFFGIIFTCTLLFCWRRGYFGIDLSKETFKIPPIK